MFPVTAGDRSIYREFIYGPTASAERNSIKISSENGTPNQVVAKALTKIHSYLVFNTNYINYKECLIAKNDLQKYGKNINGELYLLETPFQNRVFAGSRTPPITLQQVDVAVGIKTGPKINTIISQIDGTSRKGDLSETITVVNDLFKLLVDLHKWNTITYPGTLGLANLNHTIIEVILTLDTKSLSDTLQCNGLISYGYLNTEYNYTDLLITKYIPVEIPNTILYDGNLAIEQIPNFLIELMTNISKYMNITDVFFVTSDLLAAGVSSLISNIPIISTRKHKGGLLTILTLSKKMSIIACIIGNSLTYIAQLLFTALEITPPAAATTEPTFANKLLQLLQEIFVCKSDIFNIALPEKLNEDQLEYRINRFITHHLNELGTFSKGFVAEDGTILSYINVIERILKTNDETIISRCQRVDFLMQNITAFIFINNLTKIIEKYDDVITELTKRLFIQINCNQYGYNLGLTIWKLINPVLQNTFSAENILKRNINTFYASLIDMKGHDFSEYSEISHYVEYFTEHFINIEMINESLINEGNTSTVDIEDDFVESISELGPVSTLITLAEEDLDEKKSKHDSVLIKSALNKSKYITMILGVREDQDGLRDCYIFELNNNKNFLSINSSRIVKNEESLSYICNVLCGCPTLKFGIDFTSSGDQVFQSMKSSLHNIAIGTELKELSLDILDENKHLNLLLAILGQLRNRWYNAYELITPLTSFDLAARYNAREQVFIGGYQMILNNVIKNYNITINTYSGENVKLITHEAVSRYKDMAYFGEIFRQVKRERDATMDISDISTTLSYDDDIDHDILLKFALYYNTRQSSNQEYIQKQFTIEMIRKTIIPAIYNLALSITDIRPIFEECFFNKINEPIVWGAGISNINDNFSNIKDAKTVNYITNKKTSKTNTNIINSGKDIIECIFSKIAMEFLKNNPIAQTMFHTIFYEKQIFVTDAEFEENQRNQAEQILNAINLAKQRAHKIKCPTIITHLQSVFMQDLKELSMIQIITEFCQLYSRDEHQLFHTKILAFGIKSKHTKSKKRQKRFSRKPKEKQKYKSYKLQPKQTRKQIKQPIQSFLPTPTKTYKRRHHKNPKQRRSRKLDPSKLDPSKLDPRAEIRRKLLLK